MIDAQLLADHFETSLRVARMFFYFFHEATHVGELSLLRQLTAKNDKLI